MKLALGLPHTPWIPERAASMARLRSALGTSPIVEGGSFPDIRYREFTDREPNWAWSRKLWTWGYETEADWLIQLQDDVTVAPCFWPALTAMLTSLPESAGLVGLSNVHPAAPEIARRGHRWHKTGGMLVGWAWAIRRPTLGAFLASLPPPEQFRPQCEDVVLGNFAHNTGIGVWHPVPTIVDHDTSIPSTYANDNHSNRRPQVTWRSYGEGDLCSSDWWAPPQVVETLAMPPARICWVCNEREIKVQFSSGFGICGLCVGMALGHIMHGNGR